MTPLSDEELEEIVRSEMPGYTVVRRARDAAPPAQPPPADQIAADIGELRQRYLGDESDAAAAQPELDAEVEADEEVVTVAPAGGPDPGARPKKVIVSAGQRRIVGSQG